MTDAEVAAGGFPDTHTTSTYSTTTTQQTASPNPPITVDKGYLISVPGILRIIEIVIGFLYWTVVASYTYYFNGSSWVLFVAVTCWVFTVILFILFLLQLTKRVTIINWVLTELINNAADCLLHFIAAIMISIAAGKWHGYHQNGKLVWGTLCGWTLVVCYGISTFFNIREFQAMGGLGSLRFPGHSTTTTTTTTTHTAYTTSTVQQPPGTGYEDKGQEPPPYPGGPFS